MSLQSPLRSGQSSTFHVHIHRGWSLDLHPLPLQADSLLAEPPRRPRVKAALAGNQTQGNSLEGSRAHHCATNAPQPC